MPLRFVVGGVVRSFAMLAMLAFGLAVLVDRWAGTGPGDGSSAHPPAGFTPADATPPYDGFVFWSQSGRSYTLDPSTGQFSPAQFRDDDEILCFPAIAPWTDSRGRRLAAGRWTSRTVSQEDMRYGLVEYTVPDGEIVNQVECDPMPNGAPCWYPGAAARILYPASDGMLYDFTFPDEAQKRRLSAADFAPRPLAWECPRPGTGQMLIRWPVWPVEPRLGGKLLASVMYVVHENGRDRFSPWQVWWLQLSSDGGAVEAAGRLTAPDATSGGDESVHEEFPNISDGPNGLVLAYLARPDEAGRWQLRIVPVEISSADEAPIARLSESRNVGENRMAARPVFSADGCWVLSAQFEADPASRADRVAIAEILSRPGRVNADLARSAKLALDDDAWELPPPE